MSAQRAVRYFVLSWIDPDAFQELLDWLTKGHISDVLTQPGMLHAEVIVLEEKSENGRVGVMCVYRVRSRDDYLAYQASSAKARFNEEGRRFVSKMSVSRWHGEAAFDSSAPAPGKSKGLDQ